MDIRELRLVVYSHPHNKKSDSSQSVSFLKGERSESESEKKVPKKNVKDVLKAE